MRVGQNISRRSLNTHRTVLCCFSVSTRDSETTSPKSQHITFNKSQKTQPTGNSFEEFPFIKVMNKETNKL